LEGNSSKQGNMESSYYRIDDTISLLKNGFGVQVSAITLYDRTTNSVVASFENEGDSDLPVEISLPGNLLCRIVFQLQDCSMKLDDFMEKASFALYPLYVKTSIDALHKLEQYTAMPLLSSSVVNVSEISELVSSIAGINVQSVHIIDAPVKAKVALRDNGAELAFPLEEQRGIELVFSLNPIKKSMKNIAAYIIERYIKSTKSNTAALANAKYLIYQQIDRERVLKCLDEQLRYLLGDTAGYCLAFVERDRKIMIRCSCGQCVEEPKENICKEFADEISHIEDRQRYMIRSNGINDDCRARYIFNALSDAAIERLMELDELERLKRYEQRSRKVKLLLSQMPRMLNVNMVAERIAKELEDILNELQMIEIYRIFNNELTPLYSRSKKKFKNKLLLEGIKDKNVLIINRTEDAWDIVADDAPEGASIFIAVTRSSLLPSVLITAYSSSPPNEIVDFLLATVSFLEDENTLYEASVNFRAVESEFVQLLELLLSSKHRKEKDEFLKGIAAKLKELLGGKGIAIYRAVPHKMKLISLVSMPEEEFKKELEMQKFLSMFPGTAENRISLYIIKKGDEMASFLESRVDTTYVFNSATGNFPSTVVVVTFDEKPKAIAWKETAARMIIELIDEEFARQANLNQSDGLVSEIIRSLTREIDVSKADDNLLFSEASRIIGEHLALDAVLMFCTRNKGKITTKGSWFRRQFPEGCLSEAETLLLRLLQNSYSAVRPFELEDIDPVEFPLLKKAGIKFGSVYHIYREEEKCMIMLLGAFPLREEGTSDTIFGIGKLLNIIESKKMMESNYSKLIERSRKELSITRSLTSSIQLDEQLKAVTTEISDVLKCDECFIVLENESNHFKLEAASTCFSLGENGHLKLNALARFVADSGYVIICNGSASCQSVVGQLPEEEREVLSTCGELKSMLISPLVYAGKYLGFIACLNSVSGEFSKEDVEFIESVSPVIATSVENARNFLATSMTLNRMQRLDTLRTNFSSIAAHELRTPLTSIRVYIELMKAGKVGKFTEEEMKNIENLNASLSDLTQIIDNMLEFTRMEAMLLETEMSSTSLKGLVQEVCAELATSANAKSIELRIETEPDIPKVTGSAPLLKRVIFNLVSNSIKFTQERGWVKITLKKDVEGVLMVVEDNGRGIKKEDLPFIFDKYHIVDSSLLKGRSGFRLGLPIAKLIVERHGGRIWAESEYGHGSRFYVLLRSRGTSKHNENLLGDDEIYFQ